MLGSDEIKEMQEHIEAMEKELRERKKELSAAKYAGVRSAMQARKDADQLLTEELRALGVRAINWNPLFQ